MREAWQSWKAASKFLFWASWLALIEAIFQRKRVQRELAAFKPDCPQALFDAGYVAFVIDWNWDHWDGHWREKKEYPLRITPVMFRVYGHDDWKQIPWHSVSMGAGYTGTVRAVPLAYARSHLALDANGYPIRKAA